jgi:peptide/nickel transport system permease protein
MHFLIRRFLHSLFLLAGASLLSFALADIAPGDFFDSMRVNPEISPSTVAALRRQHGLDDRLPIRYLHWLRSGLKGEWGYSFAYNSPAGPILSSRARNTLLLAITATLFSWIIALPLGAWAAARPRSWVGWLAGGTTSILLATPELVLGLLLLLLAVRTRYFPVGGLVSPAASGLGPPGGFWMTTRDMASHIILPIICLAAGLLPLLLSHVRSAVSETLQSQFVIAARGYGIPFRRVLIRHVLPAAANPLISLLGLSIGMLMSSSLLIEVIFSWPGLGQLMVEAVMQRDFYLVIDAGMLATAFLLAGNLLADVLLFLSDPRIRAE